MWGASSDCVVCIPCVICVCVCVHLRTNEPRALKHKQTVCARGTGRKRSRVELAPRVARRRDLGAFSRIWRYCCFFCCCVETHADKLFALGQQALRTFTCRLCGKVAHSSACSQYIAYGWQYCHILSAHVCMYAYTASFFVVVLDCRGVNDHFGM